MDPATETALRMLRDVMVPAPVSWVPQTWGWVLLATILVIAIGVCGAIWFVHFRRNAYRRAALRLLGGIERQADTTPSCQAASAIAVLLKRTALSVWPREKVAGLSGQNWIDFVERQNRGKIGDNLRLLLSEQEYRGADQQLDIAALIAEARQWIEQHDV